MNFNRGRMRGNFVAHLLAVTVGEEIVSLNLPLEVVEVLGGGVYLGVGVEDLDVPESAVGVSLNQALLGVLVDVLDDTVEVPEPGLAVLVLEVAAHGHHDVGSAGLVGLVPTGGDEVGDL